MTVAMLAVWLDSSISFRRAISLVDTCMNFECFLRILFHWLWSESTLLANVSVETWVVCMRLAERHDLNTWRAPVFYLALGVCNPPAPLIGGRLRHFPSYHQPKTLPYTTDMDLNPNKIRRFLWHISVVIVLDTIVAHWHPSHSATL